MYGKGQNLLKLCLKLCWQQLWALQIQPCAAVFFLLLHQHPAHGCVLASTLKGVKVFGVQSMTSAVLEFKHAWVGGHPPVQA
jgi:hypothetical protein